MFESEATLVGQIIPAGLTYTSHGDMEAAGMNSASGRETYKAIVTSLNVSDGAVGDRQYTTSVKAGLAQDVKREKEERDGNEHFRPVLYIVKRVTPRHRRC